MLAAEAAGLSEVLGPEANLPDLEEIPAEVRERMRFHPVAAIDRVLDLALEPADVAMAA